MDMSNASIEELLLHIRTAFHYGNGAHFTIVGGGFKVYMCALDHFEGNTDRGMLVAVDGKGSMVITDPKRVNRFTMTSAGIPLRVAVKLVPVIEGLFAPLKAAPALERTDAPEGAATLRIEHHGGSTCHSRP